MYPVAYMIALVLSQYYDNTTFHRLIPRFMIQGGDPTGTGSGGESIYGMPFKDEFHKNLVFQHRGILACANENKPNTNGSQFFLTLDAASHLNRRHTIFGKIVGPSIFVLAEMGDKPTDGLDRPLDPPRIISVDVEDCPLEDIFPRALPKRSSSSDPAGTAAVAVAEAPVSGKPVPRRKGKKAAIVLTFGDEDEDDENSSDGGAPASSAVVKGLQAGGIGSAVGGSALSSQCTATGAASASSSVGDASDAVVPSKRAACGNQAIGATASEAETFTARMAQRMSAMEANLVPAAVPEGDSATNSEGTLPAAVITGSDGGRPSQEAPMAASTIEANGHDAATGRRRKRGRGPKERDIMSRLATFTAALRTASAGMTVATAAAADAENDAGDEGDGGLDWAAGSLAFTRHVDDALRAGAGRGQKQDDDGLVTVDSRQGRHGGKTGQLHRHRR